MIVPDLLSAVSISRLEEFFEQAAQNGITAAQPYYLLNKFDSSRALHLEIRQRLSQVLGKRLLPVSIRRSFEISEALAAGKTVVDYAPQAGVVNDFHDLAEWARYCGS